MTKAITTENYRLQCKIAVFAQRLVWTQCRLHRT